MDDDAIRVAVGLRLGSPLCNPHQCQHCGAEVDSQATHGLSCRYSEGRHHRHAELNQIIYRSLISARIPSRLEPSDIYRSDGRRPDGVTIVPWERGKALVWDATCPDTLASSYSVRASREAGAVASYAEDRKDDIYANLNPNHIFVPVVVETLGACGPKTLRFLTDLGHHLRSVTGEMNSRNYLFQRISVAIQKGNTASILGTCAP